jgi:uncharacterized membrane protein
MFPGTPPNSYSARRPRVCITLSTTVLIGWPTLVFNDSTGVFAMRIVSGILSSLFLAFSALMIASWNRRGLPFIALGVAITPMVVFLSGSVNPNALEITATLAAFTGVLSVVTQPNPSLTTQRIVIVAVAALLAANARGLSPLWLAVALLAPFLLANRSQIADLWRTRSVKIAIAVVGAGVLFAVGWLVVSNSLGAQAVLSEDERPEVPYLGESPVVGFALMITRTISHFQQMIGVFGWLDTPAPFEVYSIWILLVGSILMWTVATQRGKALRFALTLLGVLIVLPAMIQAVYISSGGWIWQGRYALPLFVILMVGAGAVLAERFDSLADRTARILIALSVVAWSVGQLLSFGTALHRYAVGSDGSWPDLLRGLAEWVPPTGIIPSLAIFGAILTLTGILSYRFIARTALEPLERPTPVE